MIDHNENRVISCKPILPERAVASRSVHSLLAQLLLHHSRCCTVCEQRTGCTVIHGMKPAPAIPNFIRRGCRAEAKASSGVERKLTFTLLRAHHEFFAHSLAFVRAKIRHLEASRREKPNCGPLRAESLLP